MKIEITIPCFNEADILENNIKKLHAYCQNSIADEWNIIIAENGSYDKTHDIAKNLSNSLTNIKVVKFKVKGRGATLKNVWQNSKADILIYMDADLATNLNAINDLISNVKQSNDLVIGSRYHPDSKINRKALRIISSKLFIKLTNWLLQNNISDFQCGFKAINQNFNKQIIPFAKNTGWWFDTEIIHLGLKHNLKIKDIPVVWQDMPSSSTNIIIDSIKSIIFLLKTKYGK